MRVQIAVFVAVVSGSLAACNFLVDAQFKDKVLPGQDATTADGALLPQKCGYYALGQTACAGCVESKCKAQLDAVCNDEMSTLAQQQVTSCTTEPSVAMGRCSAFFTDGGSVPYSDPAGLKQNLRACVTANCAKPDLCITCTDLTFEHYQGDMPHPIADQGACARCMLDACKPWLLGLNDAGEVCCDDSTIGAVWGPCLRDTPDCTVLKTNAAIDGGSVSNRCAVDLAKCALQCAGTCPGL